jgi:nucleoside-diphosphate-sugar epimerase
MKKGYCALVGFNGFVGSNLLNQIDISHCFNSSNIDDICDSQFETIYCAGIQAKKWWANQNEAQDLTGINRLLECLQNVKTQKFILISTVDVYPDPAGVDEESIIDFTINHPYGKHRFMAEEFVRAHFQDYLIIRLPGLFGTGIKKNVIHDLLNDHELDKINPEGIYQYYFLDNLKADIERALKMGISLLNVSTEPIVTKDIIARFFPNKMVGPSTPFKASYDMKSLYWRDWDSSTPGYLYDKATTLDHLGVFIAREQAGKVRR